MHTALEPYFHSLFVIYEDIIVGNIIELTSNNNTFCEITKITGRENRLIQNDVFNLFCLF